MLPRKNGTYRLEVEKGRYRNNFTNIVECFNTVEARDKWLARNILNEGYVLASIEKVEEAKSRDWSIGEVLWVEGFGKTLEKVGNLKISKFYDDFCEKVRTSDHTTYVLNKLGLADVVEEDYGEANDLMQAEFIMWLVKTYLDDDQKKELIGRLRSQMSSRRKSDKKK